jgi:hypothetical protein
MNSAMRSRIEAQARGILRLATDRTPSLADLRHEAATLQALLAEAAHQERVVAMSPRGTVVPLTSPRRGLGPS